MSRKPLQSEFDQVKNRVNLEMSHQKTALKETIQILTDFISLTKSHSEGLTKITKKEFQLFDAAHLIQPLLAQLQQQADSQQKNTDLVFKLQNDLNLVYKEIKQAKDDLLKQMELLRKERDEVYERVIKTGQGRELNDFTERATLQLATQDSTVQKYEESKNTVISKTVTKFIEARLNLLEKERNLSEGSQSRQSIQQRSSYGQSPQNVSISKQQSQKIPLEKRLTDIRKFYTDSITKETLPAQIKDQVGIFHQSMPHHMDIAKEFTQTDFHLFILQLMLLHKNDNSQWPTIIQHVKNKFKVTNIQFKTLQIDSPMDPQKSVYSSVIALTTIHQKKIALFRTVNEFWAQYLLNKILGLQMIVNQQVFQAKFEQIIQLMIFKNALPDSNFEMISEMTYPMNQCLLEMILSTIVTIDIDMDYLHLICNFSEQVLHLSGAHVSTTILIILYRQHIQPALKEKDLTKILSQLDQVVITLWKYIQSESIASLHKILKLRNCYSLFGELTSLVRHFWETLPSEGCDPFYRWLNIACNLQLEFTQKNMKELICHIMQQAGHQFWRSLIKREQVKLEDISSINELISRFHSELWDLKKGYIDKMAFCFSDQLQGDTIVLFSGFLEGFSSELLQILSDFEKIEDPDRCSLMLLMCFQLAKIDNETLTTKSMQVLGPSLSSWYETAQKQTLATLQQCMIKETFIDSSLSIKQLIELPETKWAHDYCTLLFKSIEAITLNGLTLRCPLRLHLKNKAESLLLQATQMYLDSILADLQQKANAVPNWQPPINKQPLFHVDSDKLHVQQTLLTISLLMRLCNINFIRQELQTFQAHQPLGLTSQIHTDFSSKSKSISYLISHIFINDVFVNNLFKPLYDDVSSMQKYQTYSAESKYSLRSLLPQITIFFEIYNQKLKDVPMFLECLIPQLFQRLQLAYLDANKICQLNQHQYYELILHELPLITELFQFDQLKSVLNTSIQDLKDTIICFELQTANLIRQFEDTHTKGDRIKSYALYRILMTRKAESKVKDVLKKYQQQYGH